MVHKTFLTKVSLNRLPSKQKNSPNVAPWGSDGRLRIEDALKLDFPNQRCFLYRVEVGGECYIEMTSYDVVSAVERKVDEARSGGMSLLSKCLRRYGYLHTVTSISEHTNELGCLIAKVSAVKKEKPSLNSTFGGEGNCYNLVETTNSFGEMVLHVESKQVLSRINRFTHRDDVSRFIQILTRVDERYQRLESKLPAERQSISNELLPLNRPERFLFLYSPTKHEDVINYVVSRIKRYKLLREWSKTTSDHAHEIKLEM